MKKALLTLAAAFAALAFTAAAGEPVVGFWTDAPKGVSSKEIHGVGFGIPLCNVKNAHGAELSLICSMTKGDLHGFTWAWIGMTKVGGQHTGLQLSFINFMGSADSGVQLGLYNQSEKHGVQLGFINNGRNNSTFQFGLVNINEKGLLPVMIFVNFGKDFFKS